MQEESAIPINNEEVVEEKESNSAQPCKFIVKAVKGENLLKLGENPIDPYLSLQIKGDVDSFHKSKTADNQVNPVWNQTFEFNCKDRNTDVLLVNLYDEDINDDTKLMDELQFTLKEWKIGTHIDYNQDIKLGTKNAGQLYLEFDVLDESGGQKVDTRELIFDQPKFEVHNTPIENNQEEKKVEEITQKEDIRPIVNESIKGTIINACGLPKNNSNCSDTYVVLTAFSHDDKDHKIGKVKTDIHYNTQDPVWNKDFDFPNVRKGDFVKAEIYQTRKVLGDKCIASVDFALDDLKNNEPVQKTFKLEAPGKKSKKDNDFGTLTLSLTRNVQY